MLSRERKVYKGQIYYPAEVYYGYIEYPKQGAVYLDINPDVVDRYKCYNCGCHHRYDIFLSSGYIDEEFAKENLYRCPFCKKINYITDYCANDKRRENLISNEEILHFEGVDYIMEKLTREKALESINNSVKGQNIDLPDLLQQTIDQTVQVTTHNIVDYMSAYIRQRKDYEDNKRPFDEIIGVMKRLEKKYEDKLNGEDNSTNNSDHNQ